MKTIFILLHQMAAVMHVLFPALCTYAFHLTPSMRGSHRAIGFILGTEKLEWLGYNLVEWMSYNLLMKIA